MERKSKLQLQQELRELMRGQPRKAICKMRVHELEQEIDFMKNALPKRQIHQEQVKVEEKPRGPLGPRNIIMHEDSIDSEDESTVKVPQVPAKRPTHYEKDKPARMAKERPNLDFIQNTVVKETRIVKKPAKTVKMDDSVNPELVRTKSKPVSYQPGAPVCPKCGSDKYHVH